MEDPSGDEGTLSCVLTNGSQITRGQTRGKSSQTVERRQNIITLDLADNFVVK